MRSHQKKYFNVLWGFGNYNLRPRTPDASPWSDKPKKVIRASSQKRGDGSGEPVYPIHQHVLCNLYRSDDISKRPAISKINIPIKKTTSSSPKSTIMACLDFGLSPICLQCSNLLATKDAVNPPQRPNDAPINNNPSSVDVMGMNNRYETGEK